MLLVFSFLVILLVFVFFVLVLLVFVFLLVVPSFVFLLLIVHLCILFCFFLFFLQGSVQDLQMVKTKGLMLAWSRPFAIESEYEGVVLPFPP
jgi:hypothetical protein